MSARLLLPLLLCVAACGEGPPAPLPRPLPTSFASDFDPASTGTISGAVRWDGPIPIAEPFRSIDEPLTDKPARPARDWPNPNAPRIASGTRALANCVVMLCGVDAAKSRPWDHPAACVEMRDQAYHVLQNGDHNTGFVRRGEAVDFVSRDERLHVAQARGDAFFSISLPQPHLPRSRRFDTPGVVELSSGSGYFWMRGYLIVSDHPYLTRTDDAGRFRLEQVPAGEYDLVAWHPDWRVSKQIRNPDLFRVQQVRFGPALESVRRVRVHVGRTSDVDITVSDASKKR